MIAPAPGSPSAALAAPSLARALWRTASADVSSGNAVTLFDDGEQTLSEMLHLIAGARRSVMLETYILRPDSVGRRFAAALTEAAARGVEVHLLGDWLGIRGTPRAFLAKLRQAGVSVRVFNSPGWRAWLGLVPRDHRKLLVVDERAGITGGIGLGEQWTTGILRRRRSPWRERCALIVGPAAAHMARAFERTWKLAAGDRPPRAERLLRRPRRGADLDPASATRVVVGIVEGEPWRMRVARMLHLQAAAAQRSIWIASAYFVPSFAETDALAGAAREGVDVRLLVPSIYDHPWIRGLTVRFYGHLLRNGARIWEWPGEMMHAKTTIVDGRWVRVGSTDFNPLGVAINYELDAVIEDAEVSAAAEGMFLADLESSREIQRA